MPTRLKLISSLADAGVSHATATVGLSLLGLLLWRVPTCLYSYGLYHAVTTDHGQTPRVLWSLIVGLHIATGALVYVDARWVGGLYWPLQTMIIGLALFNTLSLPALSAFYMGRDDTVGTGIALGALGLVCLSDASMVAILFELFHRRTRALRPVVAPTMRETLAPSAPRVTTMERSQQRR